MSRTVATLIASRRTGSPQRKAVLVYLAERSSEDGYCGRVSKDAIAAETEFSRSTIFKAFGELVSSGLILEDSEESATRINIDGLLRLPEAAAKTANVRVTDTKEGQTGPAQQPAEEPGQVAAEAFDGTVARTLLLVRGLTDDDIVDTVKASGVTDFIFTDNGRIEAVYSGPFDVPKAVHVEPPKAQPDPALTKLPRGFPRDDVGLVLHAAGVDPEAMGMLYWWRSDHLTDLAALCIGTGLDAAGVAAALRRGGIRVPGLARLTSLVERLAPSAGGSDA